MNHDQPVHHAVLRVQELFWQALQTRDAGLLTTVLAGVQVARLQLSQGKARSSRVMLSNVFCQEEQRWQMVLSHAFELVQDL